jgi:hypothetical protein
VRNDEHVLERTPVSENVLHILGEIKAVRRLNLGAEENTRLEIEGQKEALELQ